LDFFCSGYPSFPRSRFLPYVPFQSPPTLLSTPSLLSSEFFFSYLLQFFFEMYFSPTTCYRRHCLSQLINSLSFLCKPPQRKPFLLSTSLLFLTSLSYTDLVVTNSGYKFVPFLLQLLPLFCLVLFWLFVLLPFSSFCFSSFPSSLLSLLSEPLVRFLHFT